MAGKGRHARYNGKNPVVGVRLSLPEIEELDSLKREGESRATAARRILLSGIAREKEDPDPPREKDPDPLDVSLTTP